MSFVSNRFRKKSDGLPPWAALDQEALRIDAAMEHLQDHGNLDSFPGSQNEKLALMMTARRQRLVRWNRTTRRYELSSLGRERSGTRRPLTDGPTNPPPASASSGKGWTLGPGTIMAGIAGVAIGAAAMALLPGSSSKQLPREQAAVATATKQSGAGNDGKPSDAGHGPAGTQAQTRAPAPPQEPVLEAQNAPAATSASPKLEPPMAEEQQPAHLDPAGAVEGAQAQQLALAPAGPAPTATTAGDEAKQINQIVSAAPAPVPATPAQNATSQPAPATSALPSTTEVKPAGWPKQQPPRRSIERARTHEAAPANLANYAQSTGEASAPDAGGKPSRSRHAATEKRQSASESKQKSRGIFDWLFR